MVHSNRDFLAVAVSAAAGLCRGWRDLEAPGEEMQVIQPREFLGNLTKYKQWELANIIVSLLTSNTNNWY